MATAPLAVFALAVALRLAVGLVLITNGSESYVLSSDDGDAYVASARWAAFGEPIEMTERLAGKWSPDVSPADRWPSGYWLFLAAHYAVFGFQHLTPLVVQALLGGAGAWAAYSIASRLLAPLWPAVAGALVAASSTLVYLSATLSAEALYVPLLLVALELLLRRGPRAAVLSGALFALAQVTRPLALPVFVLALAWRARTPSHAAALLAGFALTLAPFLAAFGSQAVFTAGGEAAFHDTGVGHLAQDLVVQGVDPYHRGFGPSIVAAISNPLPVAAAVLSAVPERLNIQFLTGGWAPIAEPALSATPAAIAIPVRALIWLLAALGLARLLRDPATRAAATLLALTVLAIVLPPLVAGLPLVRYRAPADPIFLLFLTASLHQLSQQWPTTSRAPAPRSKLPRPSREAAVIHRE
ncbi:MAG TPA: hypothetical protein VGL99_29930 [Chloroflexota bacterium]